ncbi:DUF433 domain-containing protein [Herpetosiphon llansteffanensis]|uniref:DUF433 domain-containing protein n=1 Tax=Herpetosiphon llansteffanensis TaxID=2094568 RepID=UPI0013DF31CC|nr:DUF433 domain-containing protein [Herpetosiphon llansteffanensis]
MMNIEDFFEFREDGAIRIRGHRIDLAHILPYYHDGYSPEMISLEFPSLSLTAIYATIVYYLRNQAQLEIYLERYLSAAQAAIVAHEAQPRSPFIQQLKALGVATHHDQRL